MAAATKLTRLVTKLVEEDVGIALHLAPVEAQFLTDLLGACVTGPATGLRGVSDEILNALRKHCNYTPDFEQAEIGGRSTIYFKGQ